MYPELNASVMVVHPTQQPVAVVVDDNDETRQLIDIILTRLGFRVFEAANGADAIETVQALNPELVTVDIDLPDMNGFETIKRIRMLTTTSYIMAITGHDHELEILEGLGTGVDDYVMKPFRPQVLRSHIAAMLGGPRILSEAV